MQVNALGRLTQAKEFEEIVVRSGDAGTVLLKDGKAYVQSGGGVVADSTPEGEYQETVNKAMAGMRAIDRARKPK